MSTGHAHALPSSQNEKALWWSLALTSCFLLAEVVAGLLLNSLALLADAAHMFTDAAALAVALAAIRVAQRPADAKRSYGYHRFEILAAVFNALLLFAVAIYILYEAYQRFRNPVEVQSMGMLLIAVIGLIINLISMRILSGGKDTSLNLKGAYLEVWSDMLGSLGVIVAALLIGLTGWTWVDAVVAVAIGLWVLPRTWLLLKESLNILLEGVPDGIDLHAVSKSMAAVAGVTSVHDLHIWALTSGKNSLTAHVVHDAAQSPEALLRTLKTALAKEFKVFHTTLQLETVACEHTEDGCNYVDRAAPPETNKKSHLDHAH